VVTVRGQDRSKPVLFIVHGGPGEAESPFAERYMPYEKDYVVVQWDQPGAAKTFTRNGARLPPGLTLADVAGDGIEVAETVKARLHARQVIVLGWSWGSLVGVEMVRARPDLFAAYVGTGQLVNMARSEEVAYRRVLARARAQGNQKAIGELERAGPLPYRSFSQLIVQRKWSAALSGKASSAIVLDLLLAPRYQLTDAVGYLRGLLASRDHFIGQDLKGEMVTFDLGARELKFSVPILVIQGADDDIAPAEVSRAWVERISAPRKAFVPLAHADHGALVDRPDLFLPALNAALRPILEPSSASGP
jgi:pimeloyl-ACP methyl ester carboxylesterase